MFFWWKGGVNHFNQSKGICGVTSIISTDFQTTLLDNTDICCKRSGLYFATWTVLLQPVISRCRASIATGTGTGALLHCGWPHSEPTPSRRLVFDVDNHPTEGKRQQSEGDNDRMAKKNKGGRKEGRKKGREGRGGLHQLFGKNAQEVTFFSPLLWPDLCCTLFFLSSLVLQWKCPMLGDRRNGRRVKSSKLWPRNQTMTSPKEPMRLSQLIKTWPFCRNSLWSRRRTDCRCVIYIWDGCQKWIYGFLLYVKKKKKEL